MNPSDQQLQLFDQLSSYEGADVEYKAARGGLPGSLWETYSAFANTDGGTIWLGISQRDGALDPHGVDDPERLVADLWNGAHADYSGQGGIVINRYVDCIEFSNPGTLLVSREQLQSGGISECRNKSRQKMFQMLGVGDKAGSGIDKIRSSWESQHWQSPRLKETRRPDRVQLLLPMVSTLPKEAMEELRSRFGIARAIGTSKRANPTAVRAVITALCGDRYLTLRELSNLLRRKPDTLRDGYLTRMVSEGELQLRYPDKPNHPDQGYRTRSSDEPPA